MEIRGKLRRTLLAALLLDANSPVSTDRLAALLWGPDSTGAASAPLHNQITRLRHALGDEDRVRAVAPGYLIRVERGELDLHTFAEECANGHRELAARKWTAASRSFGAGLALWRGQPLADIPALADDPRVRDLEETHLRALQGRIDAELNLGRHHELIDELRRLTDEQPRHEAFRGQLMLALHRAGQHEDAVAAYAAYQESLIDELGLEPGAELRELHEAVLRRDPALSLPPNPNAPHQLPADTRTFTGRSAELAELVAEAGQSAGALVISALDGVGGIGKTALAVHAAHRLADRFPDGQLFIELRGYSAGSRPLSSGDALAYLLRSLGVSPRALPDGVDERAELYRAKLADSRTLILLDNAADAAQVEPLLPRATGCLVLITSRRRLAGVTGARSLTLDVLEEQDAVSLLTRVGGPRLDAADAPALRELVALCGYMPLALRIVAARLRHEEHLTVEQLTAHMRADLRLGELNDGERDMRALFDSSFASLPTPERTLMSLLSVLPGPDIEPYAAANLLLTDLETAHRLLDSLLEHSLLIQQQEGRYTMHDLIRAYVRTLGAAGEPDAEAARDRLLGYYDHTAGSAGRLAARVTVPGPGPSRAAGPAPEFPDAAGALAWLRAERPNLLAAIISAATGPAHRVSIAEGISPLLTTEGPWPQAIEVYETAAGTAAEIGDRLAQATALWHQGQITAAMTQDGSTRALALFGQALALYRDVGDRLGEANALYSIGHLDYVIGDPKVARSAFRRALPIFRDLGDQLGEARTLGMLGDTDRVLGEPLAAAESLRRALVLYRALGHQLGECDALQHMGELSTTLGDLAEATDSFNKALAIYRECGRQGSEAGVLFELGRIHSLTGEHARAVRMTAQAVELYREVNFRTGVALGLMHLGRVRLRAGAVVEAIDDLDNALTMLAVLGYRQGEINTLRDLGLARHRAGDPAGGRLLAEALAVFRAELDDPQGEAEALVYLGEVAVDRDGPHPALEHYLQALPLARRAHSLVDEARALDGIARCHLRLGDPEAALEPLREAVEMYRRMGLEELAGAEERLLALGG